MASSSSALSTLILPSTSGGLQQQQQRMSTEKINLQCKFYPDCRFGNNCRFLHIEDDTVFSEENDNFTFACSSATAAKFLNPQAPIFVPAVKKDSTEQYKSYADVVNANRIHVEETMDMEDEYHHPVDDSTVLCPYMMKTGVCRNDMCEYSHGSMCELCGKYCLDPLNEEQRKQHNSECIAIHEQEMEIAFLIQKSKEKTCGICFDIVWEKDGREQRFGILPNCNHCFCLECIRKWRQAKQFDNKIIRACPECRTCSDFVCPSSFWVDNSEEKEKLITKYKSALREKDCKYFKKGSGTCPFGNKCFYRHCTPDGKKVDVGEPQRPRATLNGFGQLEQLQNVLFWGFIEERIIAEELFGSDTDSDSSDFFGIL